jgi:hypothetical protein
MVLPTAAERSKLDEALGDLIEYLQTFEWVCVKT